MTQEVFEFLLMKQVLKDLKIHREGSIKLFYDNKLAISIIDNPILHDRRK